MEALVSNQLSRNTGNTEHVADSSFSDASSNLAVQEILQASIKPEYSQTCSLKPASKVHVILSHSLRYILILSSHVRQGLPSGLCPSVGSTKTQYAPQVPTTSATHHTQLLLGSIARISLFLEDYVKLMKNL